MHRLAAARASRRSARSTRRTGFNLGWNIGRVAGAGIEDHVHLHVVPRWNGDTNFMPVLADVKVLPEAPRCGRPSGFAPTSRDAARPRRLGSRSPASRGEHALRVPGMRR